MLRTLFSFIPFMVCLFWFTVFIIHYKKNDSAKRLLTWFLATCVVLYLCHGLFFTVGLSKPMESLWALCSLSVYPLYYAYICLLVSRPKAPTKLFLILLPGILVAIAKFAFPNEASDNARKVLFAVQVFAVVYFGYRKLRAFDKELANVYADTEGRNTMAVKQLLIAFVITSICSMVANSIGKQYFAQSDWLLLTILAPFTIMLFALSYIGFTRDFSFEQFVEDTNDTEQPDIQVMEESEIGKRIEQLIVEQQLYLTQNLKIGDVAKKTGICRTNISTHINKTKGMSFSDFINHLRVEHAQKLLLSDQDTKILAIATQSGFSSEQSFYRNFSKFTGMKPTEWIKVNKQN